MLLRFINGAVRGKWTEPENVDRTHLVLACANTTKDNKTILTVFELAPGIGVIFSSPRGFGSYSNTKSLSYRSGLVVKIYS